MTMPLGFMVRQPIMPNATYFDPQLSACPQRCPGKLGGTGFSRCSSSGQSDALSRRQTGQLHCAQAEARATQVSIWKSMWHRAIMPAPQRVL
jgi:hypothetical protein